MLVVEAAFYASADVKAAGECSLKGLGKLRRSMKANRSIRLALEIAKQIGEQLPSLVLVRYL